MGCGNRCHRGAGMNGFRNRSISKLHALTLDRVPDACVNWAMVGRPRRSRLTQAVPQPQQTQESGAGASPKKIDRRDEIGTWCCGNRITFDALDRVSQTFLRGPAPGT